MFQSDFKLPFTDPVLVFAVVLLAILISPLLFSRFRVPGIVGLILSGIILGPHGAHVLERDTSIILFGTVGLLYLMFMAGLEMDMNDFKANKNKSIIFGFLTFLFPFAIGFTAAHFILGYAPTASILLASMFSTHTLIAYPIIGKLGITQTRTMSIIIGGTIITDGAVLLILAVVTNLQENDLSALFFGKLLFMIGSLVFIILWGVPRLGRWFFRTMESEGYSQYLFVLAVVFLCGFLAHLAGVEPIIGAFLAGLALNQLIPNSSTLMNRIDFVGNALFIPFFLISVGMLIDFKVLTKGPEAILIALMIIIISFTGKWIAAFATQKIMGFTKTERKLIWGMSTGHAAATIAIVIIAFRLKLLDENVLNATILLILVSCLGSSLISENAGRKIAIAEENKIPDVGTVEEKILIPVSNLDNVGRLIDFSVLIRNPSSDQPIFPLYVIPDNKGSKEKIALYQSKIENALKNNGVEIKKDPVYRVDLNVANGIFRALTELRITKVILGWNGIISGNGYGPVIDRIINSSTVQIFICRLLQPINTIKRLVVVIPDNADRERGFSAMVLTLIQLTKGAGASLTIFSSATTFDKFITIPGVDQIRDITFKEFGRGQEKMLYESLAQHDLFIVFQARKFTISHNKDMGKLPKLLKTYFKAINYIVVYPQQG